MSLLPPTAQTDQNPTWNNRGGGVYDLNCSPPPGGDASSCPSVSYSPWFPCCTSVSSIFLRLYVAHWRGSFSSAGKSSRHYSICSTGASKQGDRWPTPVLVLQWLIIPQQNLFLMCSMNSIVTARFYGKLIYRAKCLYIFFFIIIQLALNPNQLDLKTFHLSCRRLLQPRTPQIRTLMRMRTSTDSWWGPKARLVPWFIALIINTIDSTVGLKKARTWRSFCCL